MFTVKLIRDDNGETIMEATSVVLRPAKENSNGQQSVVFFKGMDPIEVSSGDVYVMNENGKTVADYHLHYPQQETK